MLEKLLNWINEHDCGVYPTGVINPDGLIEIRVIDSNGIIHKTIIRGYLEARDALGY